VRLQQFFYNSFFLPFRPLLFYEPSPLLFLIFYVFAILLPSSFFQKVKLWDPRAPGECLATLSGHKAEVTKCAWNPVSCAHLAGQLLSEKKHLLQNEKSSSRYLAFYTQVLVLWRSLHLFIQRSLAPCSAFSPVMRDRQVNGAWLLTGSRDQTCKLYDLRNLHQCALELVGQESEVTSLAWHPTHERLVATGGRDGSLAFWAVGAAHDSNGNKSGNVGSIGPDDHEFGWAPNNSSNSMGNGSGTDGLGAMSGSIGGSSSTYNSGGAPSQCKPQTVIKPEDTDINPMTGRVRMKRAHAYLKKTTTENTLCWFCRTFNQIFVSDSLAFPSPLLNYHLFPPCVFISPFPISLLRCTSGPCSKWPGTP